MAEIRESKKMMAKYYTKIANGMCRHLPHGWTNFAMGMLVTSEDGEEFLLYVSRNGGRTWSDFMEILFESDRMMLGVYDAMDDAREMREYCAEEGDAFTQMTFCVRSDGEFTSSFGYEPIKKVTPAHRKAWKKNVLGI